MRLASHADSWRLVPPRSLLHHATVLATRQPLAPAEYIFTHGRAADTVSFYLQGDPNAKPGGPAEGRPLARVLPSGAVELARLTSAAGAAPKAVKAAKAEPPAAAPPVWMKSRLETSRDSAMDPRLRQVTGRYQLSAISCPLCWFWPLLRDVIRALREAPAYT